MPRWKRYVICIDGMGCECECAARFLKTGHFPFWSLQVLEESGGGEGFTVEAFVRGMGVAGGGNGAGLTCSNVMTGGGGGRRVWR